MTTLRLLPLLSSATEIVHALGLGQFQVGRSHECNFPPCVLDLPVCTKPAMNMGRSSAEIDQSVKERLCGALSLYEVDSGLIARLRPTHIITQTQCKVCAVSLEDVEKALRLDLGVDAEVLALEPYELNDLWKDIARVGQACGRAGAADDLIVRLKARMAEIERLAQSASAKPRIACIEWLEPLMWQLGAGID